MKGHLTVFNEVGKALTSTLNLKEVLNIIMSKVKELLKPNKWALLLLDDEKEELYYEIIVGEEWGYKKDFRYSLEDYPVLMNKKEIDIREDGFISMPLVSKGKVLGIIELEMDDFDSCISLILSTLGDYAAIAIENASCFYKIKELTIIDDVTGLYNSRHLHNTLDMEIKRSERYGRNLSIIFLDLDYFKNINDKYGHLNGSKVLKEVANLFLKDLRKVDIVTRYGGDEFIIILPETPKKSALKVAEKLRNRLNKTYLLRDEGLNIKITASFGIASYPEDVSTKEDLIDAADRAMYKIKNSKRDGIALV